MEVPHYSIKKRHRKTATWGDTMGGCEWIKYWTLENDGVGLSKKKVALT